tara:strand:+ start:3390 stop:3590 length:201 start_codon:yes stop_codon:yes gene_type:complete
VTDPLTAARESLASADLTIAASGPWERSNREAGYGTAIRHLRAALARVDELTAEVKRLRLATGKQS